MYFHSFIARYTNGERAGSGCNLIALCRGGITAPRPYDALHQAPRCKLLPPAVQQEFGVISWSRANSSSSTNERNAWIAKFYNRFRPFMLRNPEGGRTGTDLFSASSSAGDFFFAGGGSSPPLSPPSWAMAEAKLQGRFSPAAASGRGRGRGRGRAREYFANQGRRGPCVGVAAH